jgi:hypothetical protein
MKRLLPNAVNRLHARIILLSVGRDGKAQIAEKVGCTKTRDRTIIHRFNDAGVDAIRWYPYAAAHRMKLFHPDDGPWLNRVDGHLTALKEFALGYTDCRSQPPMQKAIRHYIRPRNGQRRISPRGWTYRLHQSAPQACWKTG